MMTEGQGDELIGVREAAKLAARHPETVRRWVWSGRLPARRRGNRLLVARRDVLELARPEGREVLSVAAWARRAEAALRQSAGVDETGSAADLVIEGRERRTEADARRAGG